MHYLFEPGEDPKEINCVICKCLVPNVDNDIKEHIQGYKHTTVYNKMLKDNELTMKDNKYHCNICGIYIGETYELQHMNGRKHKHEREYLSQAINRKIQRINEANKKLLDEYVEKMKPRNPECDTCKFEVQNMEIHKASSDHTAAVLNLGKKSVYPCDACHIDIPDNTDVKEHEKTRTHKNNFKSFLETNHLKVIENCYYCKSCDLYYREYRDMKAHIQTESHVRSSQESGLDLSDMFT